MSANGLRRPEAEHVRRMKQHDPQTRYKSDNILNMDLDPADRTTQDYEGPDMHSQVNATLSMSLAQEEQEIQFASAGPGNPYQAYPGVQPGADDAATEGGNKERRERKKSTSGKSSSRPKSAARKSSTSGSSSRRRREEEDA